MRAGVWNVWELATIASCEQVIRDATHMRNTRVISPDVNLGPSKIYAGRGKTLTNNCATAGQLRVSSGRK